ncbi:T-cell activation inhibitor, mitochondrial [Mus pahari]|uniref:T-cell activation inhibitor, mitochondrial n=1 Tax=Mus pahari TaxID=10093 RepID=UPI000A309412|nr:T-cell activation inhibitor, mitochondrial [Mus pahari]XP_029399466.1 T-cell activation inhibitor, mitochondrial [Mus pahari]XP_029399467.1 T-cell activation inhibitor, mitochondrial [Mus pahari]XP_029399468.1 T-cell activation inhibitor, mitochondrial [Mus pahari]
MLGSWCAYSEMFCHLRPLRRFSLRKVLPHWLHYSRALSGAEAINALRPFYFAVHPDFFGQHPREREVNENSLKRLSVYLENLQKPGFKSLKPTQLTFYIREKAAQNSSEGQEPISATGFRAVRFTLHSSDLLSTVLYILNSCSLPVEHVQSLNTNVHSQPLKEATGMPDRPIKWHRSYYSFTGFKDPDEDLTHVSRVETTLRSWLGSNGKGAVKKLKHSLPLRKELDRLKSELSELLQLSDIRWQRGWGVAHRCSQLHSLSRLAQQNLEPLQNVKGCTVVFTDRSGMSALGHVMLGTMDVHHHWTRLFESLPSYFDLQRRMSALEAQISNLLGGIQVVYIEELQPALTLDQYYSLLDTFYNQLLRSRGPPDPHPQSLSGLQMILSSDRYAPSLHELGHFDIPALSDPASLQSFMRTKAQQARENMTRRERLKVMENELIQASTKKFSLEKLYKEPSISSRQMVDCCKRLLEQSLPYLHGMHLCVSHFYSVMQDGDLCIPWNWKKGEAMK